jgi:RNA polymerase sigma-70 factor (ECF subfamily)
MNTLSLLYYFDRGVLIPMQKLDERQALEGLKNLDSQIIGAVYDKYFPEVYRYVRYRLSDEQAAEDIASDVFVRLLEAAQNNRGPQTNLKAWLLATASHVVIDHLRQTYRRPAESLPEDLLDLDSAPHELFDQREQKRYVQRAYTMLTSEQQHVLALRFSQGYSLEETAAVLKKNVNAVKALQFRALAALQRRIEEMNHD